MTEPSYQNSGGFFPSNGLPSPAPSAVSTRSVASLPHPRRNALRPGSSKEDMIRRFAEQRLLNVSRRYVKKFGGADSTDTVVGFANFTEVCLELDSVVNVLWLSGTPFLQVPFLLKLASDFTQYVRAFPPSPKATFSLLSKLDHCLASLLCGHDIDSDEALPGFDNGLCAGMTVTDMVRCRSLVEQTRLLVVEMMSADPDEEEGDDDEDEDEDAYMDKLHMDAARTFQHTIIQLGNRLGDPLISENVPQNDVVCAPTPNNGG
ncbi:hypothetical protein L249_0562 [Ophiocordyceps polyrhachis-furcata BCC 54312]|uniref:Meiotic recombination protein DMC1 n=1 Tax=Ophiocordyceps polyrhachis-furcata BCC 54312 TaxID=1330021 RepID=A0A367LEM5_9HYPO|nr:hypothetical protein L249_0562 [Ophiocordyceps polyrhachis-furcata BCC 54312]